MSKLAPKHQIKDVDYWDQIDDDNVKKMIESMRSRRTGKGDASTVTTSGSSSRKEKNRSVILPKKVMSAIRKSKQNHFDKDDDVSTTTTEKTSVIEDGNETGCGEANIYPHLISPAQRLIEAIQCGDATSVVTNPKADEIRDELQHNETPEITAEPAQSQLPSTVITPEREKERNIENTMNTPAGENTETATTPNTSNSETEGSKSTAENGPLKAWLALRSARELISGAETTTTASNLEAGKENLKSTESNNLEPASPTESSPPNSAIKPKPGNQTVEEASKLSSSTSTTKTEEDKKTKRPKSPFRTGFETILGNRRFGGGKVTPTTAKSPSIPNDTKKDETVDSGNQSVEVSSSAPTTVDHGNRLEMEEQKRPRSPFLETILGSRRIGDGRTTPIFTKPSGTPDSSRKGKEVVSGRRSVGEATKSSSSYPSTTTDAHSKDGADEPKRPSSPFRMGFETMLGYSRFGEETPTTTAKASSILDSDKKDEASAVFATTVCVDDTRDGNNLTGQNAQQERAKSPPRRALETIFWKNTTRATSPRTVVPAPQNASGTEATPQSHADRSDPVSPGRRNGGFEAILSTTDSKEIADIRSVNSYTDESHEDPTTPQSKGRRTGFEALFARTHSGDAKSVFSDNTGRESRANVRRQHRIRGRKIADTGANLDVSSPGRAGLFHSGRPKKVSAASATSRVSGADGDSSKTSSQSPSKRFSSPGRAGLFHSGRTKRGSAASATSPGSNSPINQQDEQKNQISGEDYATSSKASEPLATTDAEKRNKETQILMELNDATSSSAKKQEMSTFGLSLNDMTKSVFSNTTPSMTSTSLASKTLSTDGGGKWRKKHPFLQRDIKGIIKRRLQADLHNKLDHQEAKQALQNQSYLSQMASYLVSGSCCSAPEEQVFETSIYNAVSFDKEAETLFGELSDELLYAGENLFREEGGEGSYDPDDSSFSDASESDESTLINEDKPVNKRNWRNNQKRGIPDSYETYMASIDKMLLSPMDYYDFYPSMDRTDESEVSSISHDIYDHFRDNDDTAQLKLSLFNHLMNNEKSTNSKAQNTNNVVLRTGKKNKSKIEFKVTEDGESSIDNRTVHSKSNNGRNVAFNNDSRTGNNKARKNNIARSGSFNSKSDKVSNKTKIPKKSGNEKDQTKNDNAVDWLSSSALQSQKAQLNVVEGAGRIMAKIIQDPGWIVTDTDGKQVVINHAQFQKRKKKDQCLVEF